MTKFGSLGRARIGDFRKKAIKIATGISAIALIICATTFLIPFINAGVGGDGLCPSADIDVVLLIDTTGSMNQGGEQSKCHWEIDNGSGCDDYDELGLIEYECLGKSEGQGRCSDPEYTPPVPNKIEFAKDAAKSFVGKLGDSDQSALVSFNDIAILDKQLSNEHLGTQTAIDALIPVSGALTNIAHAIDTANAELTARGNPQAVKVAILLTDGQDPNPGGAMEMAMEAAAKGYKIFTIGLGSNADVITLQNIADITHGQYHYAEDGSKLDAIYNQIAGDAEVPGEICQYGSISGCKYLDADGDGDISNATTTLSNWQISLFNGLATTTQQTDADGCYKFAGLLAGEYTISEALQEGWQQTYPFGPETLEPNTYTETITTAWENITDKNFGNYFPCDDGLWCNGIEMFDLETYQCQSGTPPDCSDVINCTDDICDEENDQCVNTPNDTNCSEDQWVDTENTQWINCGSCIEKEQKEQGFIDYFCDIILDCQSTTTDFQWVDTGETQSEEDGTSCSDGDACTIDDVCSGGECVGTPINCDDEIECTVDICVDGNCQHDTSACACNIDADCDDSNPCADNICNLETYTCELTYNTNLCDDNNLCTENDICSQGVCSGVSINCDDDNVCTDDTCDPETGCVFTPNLAQCDDGDACTIDDVCSDGICSGAPMNCDDEIDCTIDSCVEGVCQNDDSDCPDTPDEPASPAEDSSEEGATPPSGGGTVILPHSILDVKPADVSNDSVTITWRTSFFATSQVVYSLENEKHKFDSNNLPKYGYAHITPEYDIDKKVTFHKVTIKGLSPDQVYYYRTISRASPPVFSQELTFATLIGDPNIPDTPNLPDIPALPTQAPAEEGSTFTDAKTAADDKISIEEMREELNKISTQLETIKVAVAEMSPSSAPAPSFAYAETESSALSHSERISEESLATDSHSEQSEESHSPADAGDSSVASTLPQNDENGAYQSDDDPASAEATAGDAKFLAGIGTFFSDLHGWRKALMLLLGITFALIILRSIKSRTNRNKQK